MKTGTTLPLWRKTSIVSSQNRRFGILMIPRGGERVVAVLRDQEDAIDGQAARAQREGVGDPGLDREAVGGGEQAADVVGGLLVRVERHELQGKVAARAVEHVRQEQAADDHVGVGVVPVLGDNRRHAPGAVLGWRKVGVDRVILEFLKDRLLLRTIVSSSRTLPFPPLRRGGRGGWDAGLGRS